MSKRALGKGLDALIAQGTEEADSGVLELLLADIDPYKEQPRKSFDDDALKELADSITEKGVIQPIIVERLEKRYQIVAGERRYRAAKLAGLEKIPAIVGEYAPDERLQIALIENIQRENLNPIEEASAYETLIKQTGFKQDELAHKVGKSRSAVANSLRLLKLPKGIKDALADGSLSPGHARALLSVTNPADRDVLFQQITSEGLSVREAEAASEKLNAGGRGSEPTKKTQTKPKSSEMQDVEQRLIEALGTKVNVRGSLSKGKIEISYFSKDDLERLYELLAGE